MRKKQVIAGVVALLVGVIVVVYILNREHWPERNVTPTMMDAANKKHAVYVGTGLDYKSRFQDYNYDGDYLNYSSTKASWNHGRLKQDDEGIPTVRYGKEYQYNPITIAQYALSEYGRALNDGDYSQFRKAVEKLLTMQDESGAFRYNFEYKHYAQSEPYSKGWVSGMAQGQVLSVFSRAYQLDKDPRFLVAGNKALDFLMTPVSAGGPKTNLGDIDPSLTDYTFFQEYITEPHVYTLNGFMFTMLGLYDWYKTTGSTQAREALLDSKDTLVKILPYYDFEVISSYDLSYLTHGREVPAINPSYHAVHITLLKALHSISANRTLKEYMDKWAEYVE